MILRLTLMLLFIVPLHGFTEEPLFRSQSKKQEEGLVVKVVMADVFVLEDGRRLKLIGVESIGQPVRKYVQRDKDGNVIEEKVDSFIALEDQALTYSQELVEDQKIKIEFDEEHRSALGYLYVYVFLSDGRMVNTDLLSMGFVRLKLSPPNLKYADKMREAYKQAREQKRGIASD